MGNKEKIPEGNFCQTKNGDIDCPYYEYGVDPIIGSYFKCNKYGEFIDVPYDNLPLGSKRDIGKCHRCLLSSNRPDEEKKDPIRPVEINFNGVKYIKESEIKAYTGLPKPIEDHIYSWAMSLSDFLRTSTDPYVRVLVSSDGVIIMRDESARINNGTVKE